MLDLSVIILTYNEELHIKRCLDNISPIVKNVFIIDCYSTDKTLEIAKEYQNVSVLQNKWVNYATQFNWALDNAPIKTKWVLRLDADEYLTESLKAELKNNLHILDNVYSGIVVPLKRVFLGKEIKHGMSQVKLMRIFKYGKARCENRFMDEHIQLIEGKTIEFKGEFADDNLNNLSWWTQKHIGYSTREVIDLLDIEYNIIGNANEDKDKVINEQAKNKRLLKHKYVKQPLFWRSFAYFCLRYFIRGGFLDGKEGFLWHFLQGWWYRTLVDAKIFEIKSKCGNDKDKIKEYIKASYNIEF